MVRICIEIKGSIYIQVYMRIECVLGRIFVSGGRWAGVAKMSVGITKQGTKPPFPSQKGYYLQHSGDGGQTRQNINADGLLTKEIRSLDANKRNILLVGGQISTHQLCIIR